MVWTIVPGFCSMMAYLSWIFCSRLGFIRYTEYPLIIQVKELFLYISGLISLFGSLFMLICLEE